MSNKINILLLFLVAVSVTGCKINTVAFSGDKINNSFFSGIQKNWKLTTIKQIDSIVIFQAVIQEELVDRDGIPEYKLVNAESKQTRAGIVGFKNYQELYLCQIFTGTRDTLCLFLSSGFNVEGKSTSVGPVYLGLLRSEQFNIKRELKLAADKSSNYSIVSAKEKKILFIADQSFPAGYETICDPDNADPKLCYIRIREIINSDINKIGGKKPVIYPIEKIFSDPDALLFKYFKTLKLQP